MTHPPFEVLCSDGFVFRGDGDRHRWQYALVPGTIDEEDRTVVEVRDLSEDTLSMTITSVLAVGDVTTMTMLCRPREKMFAQCPMCGHLEVVNDSD